MRRALGLSVLGFVLVLGAGTFAVHRHYLPPARELVGVRVAGEARPSTHALGPWLASVRDRLLLRELSLDSGDAQLQASYAQLGVTLNTQAVEQALLQHAQQGSLRERLIRAWRARRGQEQIELTWAFDAQKAALFLAELAPALARDPEEARVDLENHTKIPDVSGRELDVAATVAKVQGLVAAQGSVLQLVFREVPATTQLADLIRVDVSKVLASFETDFKGKAGRRKVNIERAVKYLNGTVIEPGDTFSFNRTVGLRTEARGFVTAPVIVDDVMEPGVGGGVCQVASTLFAASVHGNLEAVRRRSHSRPSGYAPLGLDATVIDNEVDLRLKNPYEVPLLIHAFLPTETTIKVELLGHSLAEKIEHQYSVTERQDFVRRVKFSEEVKEPKRKQKGNYGYDIVSVVTLTPPSGKPVRRSYSSKYYPVPEVYWVPPNYDLAALPALPEGATETVVGDKPIENELPDGANKIAEPPS